jgi:GntP family gluconate:H+ symporter
MHTPILAAIGGSVLWPFVVLLVSIAFVVIAISYFRIHAFLALILAALLAGVLAQRLPGGYPRGSTESERALLKAAADRKGEKLKSHWTRAIELTTEEFGRTAGNIAISIGLASIIGLCLLESGAADKVVRRFLAAFGEKKAGFALLTSTYLLSVPIFFDTMFMLMAPLAKALQLRTGKDYMLYVLCICAGGVVTHSMTVPHPGPLAMVDNLKVDVGLSIFAGFVVGIIPALGGYWVAKWINRRLQVPVRDTPGSSAAELNQIVQKPESQLPGFFMSLVPVVLPIVLISIASLTVVIQASATEGRQWASSIITLFGGPVGFGQFSQIAEFIGNKNVALMVGAVAALILVARQKGYTLGQLEPLIGPPLETAGIIILITSAGGAFGLMLKNAGMADAIKTVASGFDLNLLVLSYAVALVIRIAQGSATVAMLTTSAMIYPMIDPAAGGTAPPYHPIYLFLVIGFAAMGVSWMNDSGFWVVSRLGGLTERETLRSWTVLLTAISFIGFCTTMILATLLPFR